MNIFEDVIFSYLKNIKRKFCAKLFVISSKLSEYMLSKKAKYAECGLADIVKNDIEEEVNFTWLVGKKTIENKDNLENLAEEFHMYKEDNDKYIDSIRKDKEDYIEGIHKLYSLFNSCSYEKMNEVFCELIPCNKLENNNK